MSGLLRYNSVQLNAYNMYMICITIWAFSNYYDLISTITTNDKEYFNRGTFGLFPVFTNNE
jgi:hypothetical protein